MKVAERALEIFPNVKKYFNEPKKEKNFTLNVNIGNTEYACNDTVVIKNCLFRYHSINIRTISREFSILKPMVLS